MTGDDLADLTRQLRRLPAAQLRRTEELSQVMVSAHSTMIEGSQLTHGEALAFLASPTAQLPTDKEMASCDMLGDHARDLSQCMTVAPTEAAQLMLAFEAHHRLVCIRPFNDGNGRTSRIFSTKTRHLTLRPWKPAGSQPTWSHFTHSCASSTTNR